MKLFPRLFLLSLFLFSSINLNASLIGNFLGGGSSSSSSSSNGSETKPYPLTIDGSKRNNDKPTKYYSFYSTVTQNITTHIDDHKIVTATNRDLTIKLYYQNADGSCNTSTELQTTTQTGNFTWSFSATGGKSYCLKTSEGSYRLTSSYDIRLTGDAPLQAGITDSSKSEDNSPMEFIVALTKASSSDTIIDYTFTDGTAHNGTNYTGTNSSITIPAGEQTKIISVPLRDQNMNENKTFSITISSSTSGVSISSNSATATGTIIGSGGLSADDEEYEGPDICYDARDTSGFCMFGSCMFYKETTYVHAMVNGLSDIDVKKALTRGISFMDFGSDIGIDDTSKTLNPSDDQAEKTAFHNQDFHGYYNASMFPNGAQYRIGNGADETDGGSMNKDDRTSYYDKSMFRFGLFTQYTTLVTYTKNGIIYQEVLQACDPDTHGSLSYKPTIDGCGVFLDALNSHTKISFNTSSGIWQTINYNGDTSLNTPLIQNSNETARCENQACIADGVGSSQINLPNFLNSQENASVTIPYSVVIAEQHVGSLEITHNDKTESGEETRTIVFEAPYSPSYGGRVMFINSITDHDSYADTYHYVFREGDYWINSWDIDKNANVTIETSGNVRFFIKNNFNITMSGALNIGHSGSQTTPKFYMYLYNDFTTDVTGATAIQNGYIYTKGRMTLGSTSTIALDWGALTADDELSITNGASSTFNYYDITQNEEGLFGECSGGGNNTYIRGPFDAWDTDSDVTTRVIKTKITAQDFNLSIASLNAANDAIESKENIDIRYRLYDLNTSTPVTAWYDYNASSSSDGASETKLFHDIQAAYRDVRVQFAFCATSVNGGGIILHSLAYCENNASLDLNASTFSTDNFAIRPYALAAFGMNQYKRAAEDFNLTLKAVNLNNYTLLGNSGSSGDNLDSVTATPSYTAQLNDLEISSQFYQPTSTEITQMRNDTGKTDVTTCPQSGTFTINNATESFNNGIANASLKFTETGILDINVTEKPGSEWAKVDADDTADAQRYILPSTTTYDKSNIAEKILMLFVPYKLETTATYNTTSSQTWLYMNDINGSNTTFTTPVHAAYISYTIVAKNKDGATTQNFTKTCFPDVNELNCPRVNGLKLNTTFDLFLDATLHATQAAPISLYTEDNSSAAIYTPNKNIFLLSGDNQIQEWISPFEFENGKGEARVYLNIDRTTSSARNPVNLKLVDINTSTSWMSNPGSPKEFVGTTLNSTKTFLYGRTHAPRQRFVGQDGNVSLYYEVYCSGTACDKTLLPDGLNAKTTDDPRWFVNTHHTVASGLPGDVNQKTYSVGNGYVTQTTAPTGNVPDHVELHYNADRGYPYKTTMENNASTWLIYQQFNSSATKNEFDVEFSSNNTNWAGKKETDTTTNRNASEQTNRRMMW